MGRWAVTYLLAETEDCHNVDGQATTNKRQEQTNGTYGRQWSAQDLDRGGQSNNEEEGSLS
jgi:hypothetical protein